MKDYQLFKKGVIVYSIDTINNKVLLTGNLEHQNIQPFFKSNICVKNIGDRLFITILPLEDIKEDIDEGHHIPYELSPISYEDLEVMEPGDVIMNRFLKEENLNKILNDL